MTPLQMFREGRAVLRARTQLRSAERLGPRVRVWGRLAVGNYGRLVIGDRVRLVSTLAPLELSVGEEATLEIEDGVFINHGGSIAAMKSVFIGKNATIGPHCLILDNEFHRLEPERRSERPESRPVRIEENVWLGARVIVLPGVTIGAHTVVGAGSVVTKSLPERVVAAGVPARVIRAL